MGMDFPEERYGVVRIKPCKQTVKAAFKLEPDYMVAGMDRTDVHADGGRQLG